MCQLNETVELVYRGLDSHLVLTNVVSLGDIPKTKTILILC